MTASDLQRQANCQESSGTDQHMLQHTAQHARPTSNHLISAVCSIRRRWAGLSPQAIESLMPKRCFANTEKSPLRLERLFDHVRSRNCDCDPRAPPAQSSLAKFQKVETEHHGFSTFIQAKLVSWRKFIKRNGEPPRRLRQARCSPPCISIESLQIL